MLSHMSFKRFRADERLVVGWRQKFRRFPVCRRKDSKSGVTLGRAAGMIDALGPDLTGKHAIVLVRFSDLQ